MIYLEYREEKTKKKKKSPSFYIVAAVCVMILGGATWFSVNNANEKAKQDIEIKDNTIEYDKPSDSYTENNPTIPEPEIDTEVNDELLDVPIEETMPVIKFTMPTEGEILKDFNDKTLQYSKTYNDMRLHTGVDIACKTGTPINSMSDGTVTAIEETSVYGKTITIDHSNGIVIKYSALTKITVKAGDVVKMGDELGVSATVPFECEDKPHIHIELYKDNVAVSPLETVGLK